MSQNALQIKTHGYRAKQIEVGMGERIRTVHICGSIDLVALKVSLGHPVHSDQATCVQIYKCYPVFAAVNEQITKVHGLLDLLL